MKPILFTFYIILLAITSSRAQTLSGKVTDSETKEALPGASVFITDLKTGAVTDVNGVYEIKNLPKSKFSVQVKSIGYTTINTTVDLSKTTQRDFAMHVAAIESPEVVVTGSAFSSEQNRSSVPVVPIDRLQVTTVGADNIVSALATTPGVSSINTGSAVSKPVIRGLGYNRIVIVNEGVRQEGQQWGDEHGIEIDEFSADKIEVLKGPSSLLYGSDALGGVINILESIPPSNGKIVGEMHSHYSTNNSLTANSLMLEGNQGGFVWRGRRTYKSAIGYQTPTERVYNSGYNEKNGEAMIGLNRSWGYSHLHYSTYDSQIGSVEGKRDSASGKLLNTEGDVATDEELKSRSIDLPFQRVSHNKFSLVNNIIVGESQLRVNAGWQQNDRKEFEESTSDAGLWFHLNTITYDAKYYFPQKDSLKGIEAVIGAGGMSQTNENKGEEFLIPAYTLNDIGGFASIKKSFAKTTLNAGVRYDIRTVSGDELMVDSEEVFSSFSSDFSAVSGSIGATYNIDSTWNVKANVGRGFRAPNISELSANGVHEGTFRYEIGNTKLDPETSLQFDMGISAEGKKIGMSLDGFYNIIDNFIYYRHFTGDSLEADGEQFPVYRYVQGNSTLIGFEFSFDIHPVSNLHFENSIAYVEGENYGISQPLPFIPPVKIENELRYTFKTKKESSMKEPYIKVSVVNALEQDKIDRFETPTAGYTLINAGMGTSIKIGNQSALVFIAGNNLTDTRYFNHLSRLKEVSIYEMGRNITFGVNVPFGLK
jgi:iron complex outermembrane recepter protein